MNQRSVAIIATYLEKRPLGRIVEVRRVGGDDYVVAIDDVRDGRIQLIHSPGDLRFWLDSFRHGECVMPAAGICGRCTKLHVDRDIDWELLPNCVPCAGELIGIGAEMFLQDETNREE